MSYPLAGIRDAEHALRLYLHLVNGGGQERSLDLFDTREACERCGGGPRTQRGRKGRETEVCASCGFPWRGRPVALIDPTSRRASGRETVRFRNRRSSVRVRREEPAPVEQSAESLVHLRRVIEPRPRDTSRADWEFDLRAFAVWTEGKGRSFTAAAELGLELFPMAVTQSRWWSEWKVREACYHARDVIENRLRRGWSAWRRDAPRARLGALHPGGVGCGTLG